MYLIIDEISRRVWTKEEITTQELERLITNSYRVLDIFDTAEVLEYFKGCWQEIPEWDWSAH